MKELIFKRCNPNNFEDYFCFGALFGRGAILQSRMVMTLLSLKTHGRAKVDYPHPDLDRC